MKNTCFYSDCKCTFQIPISFLLFRFLDEKIIKDDLESSSEMTIRLNKGYSELETGGSHLLFCHAGVVQIALLELGIQDFMIDNCGVVSFNVGEFGHPIEFLGYWDPPVLEKKQHDQFKNAY